MKSFLAVLLISLALFACALDLSACQRASAATGWSTLQPGVLFYELKVPSPTGSGMKIWFYLPSKRKGKLPCVFIAPAGSPLVHGMQLGSGDRPEQLPYVQAGMAVVGYEIDGPVDESDPKSLATGVAAFHKAQAGIANARKAIDLALAQIPDIDPKQLYVAGHSSAGTLALQVAAHEPRIKGCIAYAPCVKVPEWIGGPMLTTLNFTSPGFKDFITKVSPDRQTASLRCPLFLFHADDDSKVTKEELQNYANALKKTNANVVFLEVPTGDHYDSMIQQGIPAGIGWLKKQSGGKQSLEK
jgi:dipeptidyl aminopeptidase/acylaminoacyl peptidase